MKRASFSRVFLPTFFLTAVFNGAPQAQAQIFNYSNLETLFNEPVTTSATGKPQRVSEAPVAMEIITSDDIRRSGAKDIPELLRGVPGVSVMQSTRQQYDVNIRGYNQPYSTTLLVLVNGRQVYLDHYGYTVWSSIPVQLSEIQQIEIVKGPNTALFGFNAANGVINIVTKNPLYDDTSNAGIAAGTGRYGGGYAVKTVKVNDNVGIRLSGGIARSDEFSTKGMIEPSSVFTKPEHDTLNLDSLIQLTPKSQLRIEASNSHVRQTEMIVPLNMLSRDDYQTNSAKVDYDVETDFGLIKATLYDNWLNWNIHGDLYDPNVSSGAKSNVVVAQLGDTFKAGVAHTFRIQGEYRHSKAYGDILGSDDAAMQSDILALNGMWSWAINDKWELANSARVDSRSLSRTGTVPAYVTFSNSDFDKTQSEFSYNSGLVWKATDEDLFRVNTGRGLRMPSLVDMGAVAGIGGSANLGGGNAPLVFEGNPMMGPTFVTSYELGWDHKVKPLNGDFKANVFYEDQKNVAFSQGIASFNPPTAYVFQSDNRMGSTRSVGVELSLNGKLDEHWSWGVNNTVQKIFDHYKDTSLDTEDQSPVNIANAHIGYKTGPWEADAFAYYTTRFKEYKPAADITASPPLTVIPAHISLSGRVAYNINDKTTVSLAGQEMQAARSEVTTGIKVERRVFLSLDRSF